MNNLKELWDSCLDSESQSVQSGKGKNKIPEPESKSLWFEYLEKFKDPLIIILCIILVLSCMVTAFEFQDSKDLKLLFEPAGIFLAILLSTGVSFWFEVKANNEFKILNKVKDDRMVKVIRKNGASSKAQMINVRKCDIVCGDLVRLENGDEVPADGRLLTGENLRVDESAYTGEPYANKSTEKNSAEECAYPSDFLLRESVVLEGSCYYRVESVGADTEEGKGAIKLQQEAAIQTPLNKQLGQLGKILTTTSYIIASLIMIGRVIYYIAFLSDNGVDSLHLIDYILDSIMIAVTLIVVAVPEGLPMSVNVSLALSMKKMLKEKNLVRKMHACETMGATTVICTDKTGTLTQNRMKVVENSFHCDETLTDLAIAINSTAELSVLPDGKIEGIGNPTEVALLMWLKERTGDIRSYSLLRENWEIVEREAFSTEKKYMSTCVRNSEGKTITFIKGAPEIILSMCQVMPQGTTKESVTNQLKTYQEKAMRTLGFACHEQGKEIVFMGITGIADPVRDGVREAVQSCMQRSGVRVIMVTGDVVTTAKEIGRQIGLIDGKEEACTITGSEFEALSDEEAMQRLKSLKIMSRARPEDKSRLVELLQKMGEVVAVTGDGTNDALALKKAQVGLSMGDGTARAKEVSDITIIDNSFSSINKAILWGRSLYQNIRRFIVFQMTINVCACLVVLVGAFTGMDSPLTVTQMLWVNLIMDTFAAMALSSLPADKKVIDDKPRNSESHIVDKGMLYNILATGLIFFIFMASVWQFTKHQHGLFFSTFVIVQFWNLFNVRYFRTESSLIKDIVGILGKKKKSEECFGSGFLLIAFIIILGQVLIVNCAGNFFDASPLSVKEWLCILAFTSPILLIPDLVRTVTRSRK